MPPKGKKRAKRRSGMLKTPAKPHEMPEILMFSSGSPLRLPAEHAGREIGGRNKLMACEIWLLSLDSNQEPSG